jgi:threonyl-tRNA synthetase
VEKEIPSAEAATATRTRLDELVVLFTTVERDDTEETMRRAIDEVNDALDRLKVHRILIYPYAHLSSDLAAPSVALDRIKAMEQHAKARGIETHRTPFGWCKQFTLSIKGHPLAEQLRVISSSDDAHRDGDVVSEALKAEEKLQSDWFIMDLDGQLHPIDQFDFTEHEHLRTFAGYETAKVRAVAQTPPHVTLMKRMELADNEPGSDPGNLRYYPKGRLIKSLLEQFVTQKVVEYGGMEVETPVMYDYEHPAIASYLHRFPARQYVIRSDDRNFFLRFSACFGQFLVAHDAQFSYRQLPFRIYELTRYSYRRELSGELVGLRRLRAFTMPDVHAMCRDMTQAFEEFTTRFQLAMTVLKEGLDLDVGDYELAIRFTQQFLEANRDFIVSLAHRFGRPVLIEVWPERFFYFTLKWEFNVIDTQDKASALATDQIDVENAARYDITYVDEAGTKRHPVILHCSPSGAIERCLFALLVRRGRVPPHLAVTHPGAADPDLRPVHRHVQRDRGPPGREPDPRRHRRPTGNRRQEDPGRRAGVGALHHLRRRARGGVRTLSRPDTHGAHDRGDGAPTADRAAERGDGRETLHAAVPPATTVETSHLPRVTPPGAPQRIRSRAAHPVRPRSNAGAMTPTHPRTRETGPSPLCVEHS